MIRALLDRLTPHLGLAGLCAALSALVFAGGLIDRVGRGGSLAEIKSRGVLTVATYNSPTTFFDGREGPAGFELDLARAYADRLGVALRVIVRDTEAELLAALDKGAADLAAAGLSPPSRSAPRRPYGPAYRTADLLLVCGAAAQQETSKPAAEAVRPPGEPMAVLTAVSERRAACALADDASFALARRYHSELRAVDIVEAGRPVAWALPRGSAIAAKALKSDLRAFFADPGTTALLAELDETYFGFAPEAVDDAHAAAFRRAIRTTLPKYEAAFRREADRVEAPWTVLAAIAYQESHWRADAVSPTGVRGLMMLTEATAADLGVSDRADPQQSLRGGARYLRQLYDRAPKGLADAERWWFAAAAYNVGFEHVRAAREAAAARGLDPDAWASIRTMLNDVEAGAFADAPPGLKARARTAALYVRRVRDYADVLEKRDARPLAGLEPEPTEVCGVAAAPEAVALC